MLGEGVYKCKILDAEIVDRTQGYSVLKLYFDIDDDEHRGYFFEDFKNQRSDKPVWHGVKTYAMPKFDNTKKDEVLKNIILSAKKIIKNTNRHMGITAQIDTWLGATVFVKLVPAVIGGSAKPWMVAKNIVWR